ncbi:hypothetical protein TB2_032224 [Malus domestica]
MSMSSKPSSLDVLAVVALASSEEAESKYDFPEFPEADFMESHEIQTTVGSSSTIQEEKLRQIKILLRRMIREKTAELKARWGNPENMQIVVYQPPQHADSMNMAANIHPEVAQVQEKPARSPTTVLIGDDIVSFELPEDFSEDLKTLIPEGPPRRFSFSERLDGWRISRRQRSDGGKDMYYRHEKSNSCLMRSIIEAIRFMMYETYPSLNDEDERKTRSAPRKRKASDVGCSSNDISEENMQGFDGEPYTEERVTEFFKSAYERLVNLKFVDKTETERPKPELENIPKENPSPLRTFCSSREGDADSHSAPSLYVGGSVKAGAIATTEIFQDLTGDIELSELINQRECPKLEEVGITPIRPLS